MSRGERNDRSFLFFSGSVCQFGTSWHSLPAPRDRPIIVLHPHARQHPQRRRWKFYNQKEDTRMRGSPGLPSSIKHVAYVCLVISLHDQ